MEQTKTTRKRSKLNQKETAQIKELFKPGFIIEKIDREDYKMLKVVVDGFEALGYKGQSQLVIKKTETDYPTELSYDMGTFTLEEVKEGKPKIKEEVYISRWNEITWEKFIK